MREIRTSGSEGGVSSILIPTPMGPGRGGRARGVRRRSGSGILPLRGESGKAAGSRFYGACCAGAGLAGWVLGVKRRSGSGILPLCGESGKAAGSRFYGAWSRGPVARGVRRRSGRKKWKRHPAALWGIRQSGWKPLLRGRVRAGWVRGVRRRSGRRSGSGILPLRGESGKAAGSRFYGAWSRGLLRAGLLRGVRRRRSGSGILPLCGESGKAAGSRFYGAVGAGAGCAGACCSG
jgi:hypothetical protein